MPPKKRKIIKLLNEEKSTEETSNEKELEKLGIFEDDKEIDEKNMQDESWRDVG